jgi:hypothetical protein
VAELVDAPDLGSGAERRGGSSPLIRTKITVYPPVQLTGIIDGLIKSRDGLLCSAKSENDRIFARLRV